MSAHTPGPWRKETTENASGEPMEVWEVHAESGGVVCGDFSIEADADLVAGAPDLETDWRRIVRECAGLQISLEGARHRAHEGDRAIVKLTELVAERDREIVVDDQLLAERNRLLDLFECKAHGKGCVPHAIEEVERLRAEEREYHEHRAEWAESEEVKDGEIEVLHAELGELKSQVCDTCRYQLVPEGWPETGCQEIAASRDWPVPCAVVGNRCGTWKERP